MIGGATTPPLPPLGYAPAGDEYPDLPFEECLERISPQQLTEAGITFDKGKLKCSNDFQSLQHFVESTFKLKGTWSSPSGHLKLFNEDAENIIIRYYTNTTSLLLPGDEGKKYMNILAKKITDNDSVTVREGKTKSSNCDLMESTILGDPKCLTTKTIDAASSETSILSELNNNN